MQKLATPEAEARAIISDGTSTASGVHAAAQKLIGDLHGVEPESIWMDLATHGIDPPEINRVKLLAALTLETVHSFYWDAVVFEKTALAFSSILPQPGILQEATPSQLAWAVCEARSLRTRASFESTEFDHEPAIYASVVLYRTGIVVAPDELAFGQEALDKLTKDSASLRERVREEWKSLDKSTLSTHPFPETAEGVQLARLATIRIYVDTMIRRAAEEIVRVSGPTI